MGQITKISWCDSTLNLQQGCSGCELWIPSQGVKKCYAGLLTERYAGQKGWVKSFDQPEVFPERIKEIAKWSDLTGKDRPDKPWLNGLPRIIFLDDMGDTFSEGLPQDWLDPFIESMENSPHIYMLLTKRPTAMCRYFAQHLTRVPSNFALGVTVTSAKTVSRVDTLVLLRTIYPDVKTFVSAEPLYEYVKLRHHLPSVDLVIVGGESGNGAKLMSGETAWQMWADCAIESKSFFLKQMGSAYAKAYGLKDAKGEDWTQFDDDLRVREFPQWRK